MSNRDNDWFFNEFNNDDDEFFKDFSRTAKKGAAGFAGVGCLVVALNLVVIFGVIYFVFWLLNHYGVI